MRMSSKCRNHRKIPVLWKIIIYYTPKYKFIDINGITCRKLIIVLTVILKSGFTLLMIPRCHLPE